MTHGAAPQTPNVSGATEARSSMIAFQSEPRRAASRRHHLRRSAVLVPLEAAPPAAVLGRAEFIAPPPGASSAFRGSRGGGLSGFAERRKRTRVWFAVMEG